MAAATSSSKALMDAQTKRRWSHESGDTPAPPSSSKQPKHGAMAAASTSFRTEGSSLARSAACNRRLDTVSWLPSAVNEIEILAASVFLFYSEFNDRNRPPVESAAGGTRW